MSYHAYAGIGSRETPKHILTVMDHIARYLFTEGWTLRSGGANGADIAFGKAVEEEIIKAGKEDTFIKHMEIYLPWRGFNNNPSPLHPARIPFSEQEIEISSRMHPAWSKCSPSARLMHQRNLRQIIGCEAVNGPTVVPVKFVVCWTPGGKLAGGTAQAIRIAESCNIPVINFGKATTNQELEALVLEVDKLQTAAKAKNQPATVQ